MAPTMPGRNDPARLCVPCGLCCSGVLFAWLPVLPEERWRIDGRGLPVFENTLGPALSLPCAARTDSGCGIYADRPSVCVEYQCRLLKNCLEGRIAMDRAIAIVDEAKSALAFAACRLTGEDPRRTIWDMAERRARRHASDPEAYRRANGELVRSLAVLKGLLERHFKGSSEKDQPF